MRQRWLWSRPMTSPSSSFFADEIALLKGKAPEQIKDILKAKAVFPGCRVVQ